MDAETSTYDEHRRTFAHPSSPSKSSDAHQTDLEMTTSTSTKSGPSSLRSSLFRGGILLKGLDGAIEIVGGLALWILNPGHVIDLVHRITEHEISQTHNDFVIRHLRHAASSVSLSGEHFMAVYLFLHGVVKLVVVLALLRDKLWAYPLAIVVFGAFVIYQVYRFSDTHSIGLLVLASIDLAVTILIALEYRAELARRRSAQAEQTA